MTDSATSHLLPVFARVDLGFQRGEGAWLIATNGERYLDFTSGVAVNALGHAHPHLVAALQEQATKLWHMSNLFKSPDGERLGVAKVRRQVRPGYTGLRRRRTGAIKVIPEVGQLQSYFTTELHKCPFVDPERTCGVRGSPLGPVLLGGGVRPRDRRIR